MAAGQKSVTFGVRSKSTAPRVVRFNWSLPFALITASELLGLVPVTLSTVGWHSIATTDTLMTLFTGLCRDQQSIRLSKNNRGDVGLFTKSHCSSTNPILVDSSPSSYLLPRDPVSTLNAIHHSRLTVCLPASLDLNLCLSILFCVIAIVNKLVPATSLLWAL